MPNVTLHHGNQLMVDHTPSGAAVQPATVVEVNGYPFIAHNLIPDGKLGAVAAMGGVYKATASEAMSGGAKVYWDDAAAKVSVSANAGANNHIGRLTPDSSAAADGDVVTFIHEPDGSAI